MKARAKLEPRDAMIAVGAGAACALTFGVGLAMLSTRKDFDTRTAALSAQADRAERLLRPEKTGSSFGAAALCTREGPEQARVLQELVTAEAGRAGLALNSLEARIEPAPQVTERLLPVRLRFSVTGSYDSAVGLLALLSRERPQLFVDSLDLTPKVSNVTLSLSGRVFCSA